MNIYTTLEQIIDHLGFECSHDYQSLTPSQSMAQGFAKTSTEKNEFIDLNSFLNTLTDTSSSMIEHSISDHVETASALALESVLAQQHQQTVKQLILKSQALTLNKLLAQDWYLSTCQEDDALFCTIAFRHLDRLLNYPLSVIPITTVAHSAVTHSDVDDALMYDGEWNPIDPQLPNELYGTLYPDTGVIVLTPTGQGLVLYYAQNELHVNQLKPVDPRIQKKVTLLTQKLEAYAFIPDDLREHLSKRLTSSSYVDQWLALGQMLRLYHLYPEHLNEINVLATIQSQLSTHSLQESIDGLHLPTNDIFDVLMDMEGWGYLAEDLALNHVITLHELLDPWDVMLNPDTFDALWDDPTALQQHLTSLCTIREQVAWIEHTLHLLDIETTLTVSLRALDERALMLLSTMPKEIFNSIVITDKNNLSYVKEDHQAWWTQWLTKD